jgi:hypothetical protein
LIIKSFPFFSKVHFIEANEMKHCYLYEKPKHPYGEEG